MSQARHMFVRTAVVTCGCVLMAFAFGCGDRPSPSPTAPDVNPGVSSSPPAGQTHIRGSVSDTVRRPLPGALVAVLDGPLAGTTKLTDAEGKFELTGTAAGTATLRVSLDGFQTKTQSVSWRTSTSGAGVDGFIQLDTLEPPIGLDPGDYTLTIAIDLAAAVDHPGIPKAPARDSPSISHRSPIGCRFWRGVPAATCSPITAPLILRRCSGSPSRDGSSGSRSITESPTTSLDSAS